MRSFVDAKGDEWILREITEGDREEILSRCKVDIIAEADDGMLDGIPDLLAGSTWRPVVALLVREQLAERGMTFDELRLRLGATAIAAARKAVLDTFLDFFRETASLRAVQTETLIRIADEHRAKNVNESAQRVDIEPLLKKLSTEFDDAINAANEALARQCQLSGAKPE